MKSKGAQTRALWTHDREQTRPRLACASTSMALRDYFDNLPDPVLLLILNRLADIKALGRCCAVSRRFRELVLQVDNAVVKVDCVISREESSKNLKGKGLFRHLMRFVVGRIVKPLQALHQFLGPKKSIAAEVSHHSPCKVIKNFKELQRLRIELPGGELGMQGGGLLKWKAEFGSTLDSCVILAAASVLNDESKPYRAERLQHTSEDCNVTDRLDESEALCSHEESDSSAESFYTDGGLKLRVIWTISSLIAASARHHLLQQIISDHPTLESLILTDADGQGMLCMNKEQLHESREKPLAASSSANRTEVPDVKMKLWYAPYLELPGGIGLKGATLVAIKRSDHLPHKMSDEFVAAAFEEPFKTAVSLLVRRRTYLLEMNSF
ncbi:hypothetical protein O6H91_07G042400 [Diphasiastrum complanatum]|uniref:Uncharacterized protein n=3 Tax=Diphasiastrum complanatum TaxID=34168 RepID=A0ACC2D4I6_DIPCM|nr:hypothetical protein O6H91_07G042400 [Diphasiastrum complanatum]